MPWYLSKGSLKIIKMANSIVQTMSKIASFIPRQHLTTPLGWSLLPIGWSECPSVCLSRSGIMSKRINMSSKFFHHRVATPTILVIFIPNGVAIFLREPPHPPTDTSNAGGGIDEHLYPSTVIGDCGWSREVFMLKIASRWQSRLEKPTFFWIFLGF